MPRRVLIVCDGSGPAAARASELQRAASDAGYAVARVRGPDNRSSVAIGVARVLARTRRRHPAVVITVAERPFCHMVGLAMGIRGVPWIADVGVGWRFDLGGRWRRQISSSLRLLRGPDLVLAADGQTARSLHDRAGSNARTLGHTRGAGAELGRHLDTLTAVEPRADGIRVLMLGPINAPHVEHLALAMHERGHRVVVGGEPTPVYPATGLPEAGVRVSTLTFPATAWLRRLNRTFAPDVVHAHWLSAFAFLAALVGCRPLIAMAWGSDVYGAGPWGLRACRFALRRADLAMSDSQALCARLIEMGADPARTRLLNWGVDLQRFSPAADRVAIRRSLGLGEGPTILSPRAVRAPYNPEVIVDAYERLAARIPGLQLVLKHIEVSEPKLAGRPLPDGVRVVGHVPYERMADYYRAADVCISIPDSDSSPRSVWEAMACGVPCVLSDLPWAHELIEPGVHALLVKVDATAVACAAGRLLEDRDLHDAMVGAGRELVEHHRDRNREMDGLSELYLELAAAGARRR